MAKRLPKIPKETGEEALRELDAAVEAEETVGEYAERLRRALRGSPDDTIQIIPIKQEGSKSGLDPDEPVEDHESNIRRVVRRMMRD